MDGACAGGEAGGGPGPQGPEGGGGGVPCGELRGGSRWGLPRTEGAGSSGSRGRQAGNSGAGPAFPRLSWRAAALRTGRSRAARTPPPPAASFPAGARLPQSGLPGRTAGGGEWALQAPALTSPPSSPQAGQLRREDVGGGAAGQQQQPAAEEAALADAGHPCPPGGGRGAGLPAGTPARRGGEGKGGGGQGLSRSPTTALAEEASRGAQLGCGEPAGLGDSGRPRRGKPPPSLP